MNRTLKGRDYFKPACPLCDKGSFAFYLTTCKGHPGVPLIVATTHKKEFDEGEKRLIKKIFPKAQFDKRKIGDHAHAHGVPR